MHETDNSELEIINTGQDALNYAVMQLQRRRLQLRIKHYSRRLSGIEILECHDLERTIVLLQAFEEVSDV